MAPSGRAKIADTLSATSHGDQADRKTLRPDNSGRPATAYAAASADRNSVRWTRPIGVTPGISVGPVRPNTGRPARVRSASTRARSSRK